MKRVWNLVFKKEKECVRFLDVPVKMRKDVFENEKKLALLGIKIWHAPVGLFEGSDEDIVELSWTKESLVKKIS